MQCTICGNPVRSREKSTGLCPKHAARLRRYGDPTISHQKELVFKRSINFCIEEGMLQEIDEWAKKYKTTRSEAVRILLEHGLNS